MIVCKFGGTSVANLQGAKSIKEIVLSNENRKIVVVSALGKCDQFNYKITDKLFELFSRIKNGEEYISVIDDIFERYNALSKSVNVSINWNSLKQTLLNNINQGCSKAYIVSRGEYYSAILYSKYLGFNFLDAKDYIFFKRNGEINLAKTSSSLRSLNKKKRYIIGGFYGSKKSGEICIFDRGGSDITGAIIAKCLNLEVYENYTDVDGVYDKNPNIFSGAKSLPILKFKTAILMADAGNEIVHKDALYALKDTNTILLVKSTNNHTALGTVVVDGSSKSEDIYICVDKCPALIFNSFDNLLKNEIGDFATIKSVIKKDNEYIVLLKNCIKDDEYLTAKYGTSFKKTVVFKIFSEGKINNKYIKSLNKIKKITQKYSIFSEFLSYFNNFTIISSVDDKNKIVSILGEYLQK